MQYHYAIRHVVKENTKIRNKKLAEAVSENNDRVLWEEVRKMSKTNKELPTMMDGLSSSEEITDIFADKYKILYNTVSYDAHDLNRLTDDIESRIENSCLNITNVDNQPHIIKIQEVKNAIYKLKQGKKRRKWLIFKSF